MNTLLRVVLLALAGVVGGCAGPHGEKPALDTAAQRPGSDNYGFSGGYVGATGGGFR